MLDREVWLMSAFYLKRYVKARQERCCRCRGDLRNGDQTEMRFAPINSREQQATLSNYRLRSLLIKQLTRLAVTHQELQVGYGPIAYVG